MNVLVFHSVGVKPRLNKVKASGGCHRFLEEYNELKLDKIWVQIRQGAFDVSREKTVQTCHVAYLGSSTLPVPSASPEFAELNVVMTDIVDGVSENSILLSDAGNFYGWIAKYFRCTNEKEYIGSTSEATRYGLPAVIGAKAACPEKTSYLV